MTKPSRLCAAVLALFAASSALVAQAARTSSATVSKAGCGPVRPAAAPDGPSASAEIVQRGDGEPTIAMVRYPRPDRPPGGSNPWSQWGQGLVLRDGRFLSAMGDHRGQDGDSYLFVYDPERAQLTRFADVQSATDYKPGDWGFGKIHGQIVPGPCGDVYFATYWGTRGDIQYNERYRGDELFRIDPSTLALQALGAPVEKHGIPSLAGLGGNGLLYGEAVDPFSQQSRGHEEGAFFVYDVRNRRVVFRSDVREHSTFRNVLLDGQGRAYVAGENGALLEYEPGTSELRDAGVRLPGGGPLRASTRPGPDGTVYGVTQGDDGPSMFFALSRDGTVRNLGAARGYTPSMALEADGSRFYYVPGGHGDSYTQGTPVIAVDTKTGDQQVVARLNDLGEEHLGLTLGGSYDVALDTKRHVLYVGLNAGETRDRPWGEVVLAILSLQS
jgi:hypothetical protein